MKYLRTYELHRKELNERDIKKVERKIKKFFTDQDFYEIELNTTLGITSIRENFYTKKCEERLIANEDDKIILKRTDYTPRHKTKDQIIIEVLRPDIQTREILCIYHYLSDLTLVSIRKIYDYLVNLTPDELEDLIFKRESDKFNI